MEQNPGNLQKNGKLNFSMWHIFLSQQYKYPLDWIIPRLKKYALTCISIQICLKIEASIVADTVAVGSA